MEAVVAEQEIVEEAGEPARLFVDGHDSSLIVERESAWQRLDLDRQRNDVQVRQVRLSSSIKFLVDH